MKGLIPQERIEQKIFVIRGQKVMLDGTVAKRPKSVIPAKAGIYN